MKKLALLLSCAVGTLAANAQLSLSGTSYTQNFDNIGSGLPTGWSVRLRATPTFLGTDTSTGFVATPGSTTVWNYVSGNYRNAASANGFANYAAGTATLQGTATDRALAVRQVASTSTSFPGSDSGAAFVLEIANTTNLSNFNLSFKLQSLDSTVARVTTWKVDYGFGTTPASFTTVTTTGTVTTGGNTYSNNTITASFGSALNNNAGPVWIRVVALNAATGSGSRATTGIDDFNLTWSGGATSSFRPVLMSKSPANGATNVAVGTNLKMGFDRVVTGKVAGNIYIKNETNQSVQTIAGNASNVTVAGDTVTVSGLTLALGKTYHVTFDSAAFDTAGYKSYGLYDTTSWKFSTPAAGLNSLSETFTGCTNGNMLGSFTQYSVSGSYTWRCSKFGNTDTFAVYMNGGSASKTFANEDWLISPRIDVSAWTNAYLQFYSKNRYQHGSTTKQVYISTNYSGTGSPAATGVTWTNLNVTIPADSNVWTAVKNTNLTSYKSQNFYIAFKYVTADDTTAAKAEEWSVDDVNLTSAPASVFETAKSNFDFSLINNPSHTQSCRIAVELSAAQKLNVDMVDMSGRTVKHDVINATAGQNNYPLSFNVAPGIYFIRVYNEGIQAVRKLVVE